MKNLSCPYSKLIEMLYKHNIMLMTLVMNLLFFYSRKWLKSARPFCTDFNLIYFYYKFFDRAKETNVYALK